MSGTREELVFMASLADRSSRYDHVIDYMTRIAAMGTELNEEERNYLHTAYKQSVGQCRQALREVEALQKVSQGEEIRKYYAELQSELFTKCEGVIGILARLIPISTTVEGLVFLQKMQGDYHRYIAEFVTGDSWHNASSNAQTAYRDAMKTAEAGLPVENVIRIGLALNFSVFLYEVVGAVDPNGKTQAIAVARKALTDAMSQNPQAEDSRQLLHLLDDNLNLWTAGRDPDDGTVAQEL
mmetsp:Transcript_37173/g.57704  ORF Transcript_37173/g.57704 Transcript_37173/m.57704 type:complete len:240 (+) Transcript_37173:58-777(+)|eukprot:CAMPEP_0169209256 /NCGR_PEP_ID=MMETSP1016-20121227/14572_1 /TAXON_ID=342587 /ORGANISM="Karlodinium micrum, Strain CCMP2283" /LENGTH=239 /DNA_ID=CAMNT_0009286693 /DNA_START=58 /DNA_END=777 /DNA_ORIENTATION=-